MRRANDGGVECKQIDGFESLAPSAFCGARAVYKTTKVANDKPHCEQRKKKAAEFCIYTIDFSLRQLSVARARGCAQRAARAFFNQAARIIAMADDSTLPPPLTTTTIANIAGKLEPHDCRDVADELFHWLLLGIALPALVNVAIIILYAWTYVTIRSFRLISDQIVSR